MGSTFEGRKILLGVSGSIAVYKACEVVRLLVKAGALVRVIMTANATKFVSPLTFFTLSQHKVYLDCFDETDVGVTHIELAQWADMLLILPATANILGKCAHGIGDDLLSTVFMAFSGPVFVAPAMNPVMYENKLVQTNIRTLLSSGIYVIQPQEGEVACGEPGRGRLKEPKLVLDELEKVFMEKKVFAGLKFLVTAGPTREFIDPMRFISNTASGLMGYCIARESIRRGAEVTLITGPVSIDPPPSCTRVPVTSAREMAQAVECCVAGVDVLFMTAAVADFSPKTCAKSKIKKTGEPMNLELEHTVDIVEHIPRTNCEVFVVGFAAETENEIENDKEKMRRKKMDMIVVNNVAQDLWGIGQEENKVTIITKDGHVKPLPLLPKSEVAKILLDEVEEVLRIKGVL
jgi:phosphopantothenoylcysteine decarboxylase/phosphopantothenate--cysteine ligase